MTTFPPQFFLTDYHSISENTQPALIIMNIHRSEIESGNISHLLVGLHALSDSIENVHLYQENLIFMVSGYDADKRELVEIQEVRDFFHRICSEWPHFLWYLRRGAGQIELLFCLLCQVDIVRRTDNLVRTEFKSVPELRFCVEDMFLRGNALFDAYSMISEKEIALSATSALEELGEYAS